MYLILEKIYRGRRVPAVLWPDPAPNPGHARTLTLIRIRDGKPARAIALVTAEIRDDGKRRVRVEGARSPVCCLSGDRFALRYSYRDAEGCTVDVVRGLSWDQIEPLLAPLRVI